MRQVLIGIGLALVTCLFLALLPVELARGATSNLMTLIAAIYVGFAVASKGVLSISKQVAGCVFFVALALLGLWASWWFLVAGFALHGIWDFLHHGEKGQGVVPQWYVSFCAVYDWVVALFISLFFAAGT